MNDQNRKIYYPGYGLFADEEFGQTLSGENYEQYLNDRETVLNFAREAHLNLEG